jgi:hypothetical protein
MADDQTVPDTACVRAALEATGETPKSARELALEAAKGSVAGILASKAPASAFARVFSGLDDAADKADICLAVIEAAGKSPSPALQDAIRGCGIGPAWLAAAAKKAIPAWLGLPDGSKDLVAGIRMTLSDQDWRVLKGVELLKDMSSPDALSALVRVANLPDLVNEKGREQSRASRGPAINAVILSPSATRDHLLAVLPVIERYGVKNDHNYDTRLKDRDLANVAKALGKHPVLEVGDLIGIAAMDWTGASALRNAILERGTPDAISAVTDAAMADDENAWRWANALTGSTSGGYVDIIAGLVGAKTVLARRQALDFFAKRLEEASADPQANAFLIATLKDDGFMANWSNDAPNKVRAAKALAKSSDQQAVSALRAEVLDLTKGTGHYGWGNEQRFVLGLAVGLSGDAWRKDPVALDGLLQLVKAHDGAGMLQSDIAAELLKGLMARDEPAAFDAIIDCPSFGEKVRFYGAFGEKVRLYGVDVQTFLDKSVLAWDPERLTALMECPVVASFGKEHGRRTDVVRRLVEACGAVDAAMPYIERVRATGVDDLEIAAGLPACPEREALVVAHLDSLLVATDDKQWFRPDAAAVTTAIKSMDAREATPASLAACVRVLEFGEWEKWKTDDSRVHGRGASAEKVRSDRLWKLPEPLTEAIRHMTRSPLPEAADAIITVIGNATWDRVIDKIADSLKDMPDRAVGERVAMALLSDPKSGTIAKSRAAEYLAPKADPKVGVAVGTEEYLTWAVSEHADIRKRFCQDADDREVTVGRDVMVARLTDMLRDGDDDVAKSALMAIRRLEGLSTKTRMSIFD